MEYQIIVPEKIEELMFNEGEFIIEFCEAGLSSYAEFSGNFTKHLQNRDLEGLKKTGHKIKPGLEMMGAQVILKEYEHAKQLLESGAGEDQINQSIEKMTAFCNTVEKELKYMATQY